MGKSSVERRATIGSDATFATSFKDLTDHAPFPWQRRLFDLFVEGQIPSACSLPTGLGKTSVVAVWLMALARCAGANRDIRIPRRLVYVVNRRTVVDQTTAEVERYCERLAAAGIENALRGMCAIPLGETESKGGEKHPESPLALSTLRGQFADNRQWSADPARPAVIVGTVDMIGSRLLFSGYGVGFKVKPLHAGFLGQDALLVHDEAHLEPAFQKLLDTVVAEQQRCGDPWPLRVMALSATLHGNTQPFTLDDEVDPENPVIKQRIRARKRLALHVIENERAELAAALVEHALALKDTGAAVLVFARSVETVEQVVANLKKKLGDDAVQQLTGTMRGLERDQLATNDPIFARFQPKSDRTEGLRLAEGTVYLVCTSAGEVGVNISADHLVCDLSTLDSMIQRFGRVNRFGERKDTQIHVVHPQTFGDKDDDARREKTLKILQDLKRDASPAALGKIDAADRDAAFAPPPTILSATDILFDSWSLTTIRDKLPGRPPVEPYLHGVSEFEPPETHVAWREEVDVVNTRELLDQYPPADLLEDYPLKPHELLRDRSDRVQKHLEELAKRSPNLPAWVVDPRGDVERTTLEKLANKESRERINNCTVLLSPAAGGLSGGLLDGSSITADDVADDWQVVGQTSSEQNHPPRQRVRVWDNDPGPTNKTRNMRLIRKIDIRPDDDDAAASANGDDETVETAARHIWSWYERPRGGDGEGSQAGSQPELLQVHTDDVVGGAQPIGQRLSLPPDLQQALELAARWHDLGKDRPVLQRALGRVASQPPLAKSGKRGWLGLSYRHEFGSLMDVRSLPEFQALLADVQELTLHLIAAHHGRARPHFPEDEAFDWMYTATEHATGAVEAMRRFGRLQRRYGRWGLAYLESLLRAADYAASANPSRFVEELSAEDEESQS